MWCMDSYGKFMELAMKPKETGAYLRQSVFYFKDMVEDLPAQLDKMNELCHLPGFRHDSKLIEETGKNSSGTISPLRWNIWYRREPEERQRERQEKKKRLSLSRVRSVLLTYFFCLMLIRASSNKGPSISYLLVTSTHPLFLRAVALHLNSS